MPIGSRLTHTVAIKRTTDTGAFDDYNQPIVTESTLATVKAAIQPRTADEMAAVSQAGAGFGDHVIFMLPTDVTGADAIEHDQGDCPLTSDLPTLRFEIDGIRNAAGLGHHLEIDARLVQAEQDVTGS